MIQVDSTPPSSSITCNGSSCSSSPYGNSASVALSATDNGGGAGIAGIYYTTDGSAPTQSSADLYSGPFTVTSTTTIKYFTVDNAGNVEPTNTRSSTSLPRA